MKNQTSKTEQFCHSILGLGVHKSKSLANLVMGLASQLGANSVTEISLSPCYHYQFSSISKLLTTLFEGGEGDWAGEAEKNFALVPSFLS